MPSEASETIKILEPLNPGYPGYAREVSASAAAQEQLDGKRLLHRPARSNPGVGERCPAAGLAETGHTLLV